MSTYRLAISALISIFLLSLTIGTAWADRNYRHTEQRPAARHIEKNHVIDKRHHHNKYYPRRGHVVRHLPARHHKVKHHGSRYYFSGGVWYRPSGVHFSVIAPPFGVVIPILPHFYTTVWFGGVPYYYAAGTYYRWYPEERGYIVTEPPEGVDVYEEPEIPDELFVYPRAGQNEEMQALDRYECHRWAADETGFDPTRPGGNVPVDENFALRTDYNRATKACLEAREYSVQ